MRVLLIYPLEESQVMPVVLRPLALEMLAANLREHDVEIFDMRVDLTSLEEKLASFKPELIGVTCNFTIMVPNTLKLLKQIKAIDEEITTVVGGVHPSLIPEDFAEDADYIVRGPGEESFKELISAIEDGEDVYSVRGIYIKGEGGLHFTDKRLGTYEAAKYSIPTRHLTEKYSDKYTPAPSGESLALVITSRGCPHRCNFCAAWKVQDGKFLARDANSIVEELAQIKEQVIYFFDDDSFGNVKLMHRVADMIEERGIKKKYQIWARTDQIAANPDLIQKWAKIGLTRMFSGLEAISDSELKSLSKTTALKDNEKAIQILKDNGILLTPTFIVSPGYTKKQFELLHEYVVEREFRATFFFILTPLPGTDLYEQTKDTLLTRDYLKFDLCHITLPPEKLSIGEFMTYYADLFLKNPSWRESASRSQQYAGILSNICRIRDEYLS